MSTRPSNKTSLGKKAYQQIRELIITLQLKPSEQVDESTLEKRLSIGRTPIREALLRLAGEKLLDSVPGRGFFVRPISIDDIKELFEALTILERIAVHLASQRITEEQIQRLTDINERHKAAMAEEDFLQVTMLNGELHRAIYQSIRNDFLQVALDGVYHQAERLGYLTYSKEAHPKDMSTFNEKAIQDHEDLIDCFRAGNSEGAVETITAHSRRFFLRICHYMEPRIDPLESFIDSDFFMEPERS